MAQLGKKNKRSINFLGGVWVLFVALWRCGAFLAFFYFFAFRFYFYTSIFYLLFLVRLLIIFLFPWVPLYGPLLLFFAFSFSPTRRARAG